MLARAHGARSAATRSRPAARPGRPRHGVARGGVVAARRWTSRPPARSRSWCWRSGRAPRWPGARTCPEHELGRLLAAARKELRQTVVTLGGSGWCERAEGLISDRARRRARRHRRAPARRPPAQLQPVRGARAPPGAGNRRAGDRPGRPPGAGAGGSRPPVEAPSEDDRVRGRSRRCPAEAAPPARAELRRLPRHRGRDRRGGRGARHQADARSDRGGGRLELDGRHRDPARARDDRGRDRRHPGRPPLTVSA